MPLNILIVGAGICGPALAYILQKSNAKHHVTVVERFPSLRLGGQQIDLKSEGVSVAKAMGLLDTIKSVCVRETGLEIVDTNGKRLMSFGIDDADGQGLALTAEYEMMRGDLVKVFYEASLQGQAREGSVAKAGNLEYEFGKTVTEIFSGEEGVDVTFSDGQKRRFDLVVGADGQSSRIRRLAFGQATSTAAFKPIGVHAAFYSIPRAQDEDSLARGYFGSRSRAMMTRTSNRPLTQVYLFLMGDPKRHEKMATMYRESSEKQKSLWTEIYSDAGWQCDRFLAGLETCDDFYACELGQVKMPQLFTGRVVLLGDAGYCPSPFTGMGTSLSLVGAYVLAGELTRHGDDVEQALEAYEKTMRQPIDEYQELAPGSNGSWLPTSQLGINIMSNVMWVMSCLRVDSVIQWIHGMLPDSKPRWTIPEYPELNLGASGGL
jgi:2-polyprenyl-6-methoxyphenol hydroxylase-like FAD-dependent oxidoreductase